MKREPSIHITKSKLQEIIDSMFKPDSGVDTKGITDKIFQHAKPHSLHTRTVTVSSDRMEKKAKQLVQASRRDADLLAQLIYHRRKLMKHRGISLTQVASKDWVTLKGITAHALDFTNEFNLTRKYGFSKYVEVALSKMKKFHLNKFIPMYQGICETYQAMLEIEKDDDSEMTKEMYKIYARRVIEHTGILDPLGEMPEKYVWFVRAREQSKSINVSVSIYMMAQFAGLDFTNGIPHPTQLVGPKATERVVRYCYQEGIKIKGQNV
jgi:hypothetical protein